MKNNWFSTVFKYLPLIFLVAVFGIQNLHTNQVLQSNNERASRQYETLTKRMNEDNIPYNIKYHIAYVAQHSAFNTDLVVSSISNMQNFIQFIMLLVLFTFYLAGQRKSKDEDKQ